VDNEGCFSGGFTHPHVLGKVVRLALQAGTELVFSPVRHPQSNGYVERFHRDYNTHVWEDTYLSSIDDVQERGEQFFVLYRQRPHSRLHEQTPYAVHASEKRPLYEGKVHFMRKVLPDQTVSVLNVAWALPKAKPGQGVWVTLDLRPSGATLFIYDAAPDANARRCLAAYKFPLSEPVQPHPSHSAKQTRPMLFTAIRVAARLTANFLSGTMS